MAASDLLAELRNIQALLAQPPAPTAAAPMSATAAAPPLLSPPLLFAGTRAAAATQTSDDEEPELAVPALAAASQAPPSPQGAAARRELEREAAALRAAAAEDANKIKRLEEALEAAQQDGGLVAQRLRVQLAAKAEESSHLAELVFSLRGEGDALRAQLAASTQAAQDADRSTTDSVERLQAAAAEWRRHGEEAQQELAAERERSAALAADVQRLQGKAQELRRALDAERAAGKAAASEAASAAGSEQLVAALRERCAMERSWRKAVCQWLQGELHTKTELERVLLNVGAAVHTGHAPDGSGSAERLPVAEAATGAAPPLPPRRVVASQLVPSAAAAEPSASVSVTVVHSPRAMGPCPAAGAKPARSDSSCCVPCGGGGVGADWREQYQRATHEFEARRARLQAELAQRARGA